MSKTANSEHIAPLRVWQDASLLEIQGPGSADFLQGYLTCDTNRVNATQATPMAICNVKGRVLASGWAIGLDDGVGLVVHTSVAGAVAQFLKPYLTFSKCNLVTSENHHLALNKAPPGIELCPGYYLSLLQQRSAEAPNVSAGKGVSAEIDVSAEINDTLIAAGFAFISAAVSEKYLPQMLALDKQGAVDFDKGCYLGQEIVARAEFRGAVKRKLIQFSWSPASHQNAPEIGSVWQTLGTVVSVGSDGQALALAKTNTT